METLNSDILRLIFRYLNKDELRQCFRVCKSFYLATQNQTFWVDFWKRNGNLQAIKSGDDKDSYINWREIRAKCQNNIFHHDYKKIDFNRLELVPVNGAHNEGHIEDYKLYYIFYKPVFSDLKKRTIRILTPIMDRLNVYTYDDHHTVIKGFYNDESFHTFLTNLYKYFVKTESVILVNPFSARVKEYSNFFTKEGKKIKGEKLKGTYIHPGTRCYMLVEMSMVYAPKERNPRITWNLIALYFEFLITDGQTIHLI